VKKITSFCRALKRCTQKKIGPFFLPHGVCRRYSYISLTTVFLAAMNPFHGPANWPAGHAWSVFSGPSGQSTVTARPPTMAIYIQGHRRPYCASVDRADQVHAGVIVKRWTVQIRGGVWTQGHRHEQLKSHLCPSPPPPRMQLVNAVVDSTALCRVWWHLFASGWQLTLVEVVA